jgi:AraC-like DNA-binding protein
VSNSVVVAAVSDHEWCAHVRAALESWTTVRFVPTLQALSADAGQPAELVLWHLGATGDVDDACLIALERVRRRWTQIAVVAYCQVSVPTAPLLIAAGRVGIDRLLLRGHDDLRDAIRRELRERGVARATRDVLAQLELPPGPGARVFAHCVQRVATTGLTIDLLASDLGVHRKTVRNWLRAASLPSPEQVISWTRLFVAASLLQAPNRTVASVASWLGFASESALRGMLMRHAAMTPRELRQSDGFTRLIAAFRASCYANAGAFAR